MKYAVQFEERAIEDLETIATWIAIFSEDAARTWHWRVREAIDTLGEYPLRCSLAPENENFKEEIRQLLFGRKHSIYRILFTVRRSTVHVFHIRHGSRKPLQHPVKG